VSSPPGTCATRSFLITQPESIQSDSSVWRAMMGSSEDRQYRGGGQESRTGRGDRGRP
jgi:hypothetical protein